MFLTKVLQISLSQPTVCNAIQVHVHSTQTIRDKSPWVSCVVFILTCNFKQAYLKQWCFFTNALHVSSHTLCNVKSQDKFSIGGFYTVSKMGKGMCMRSFLKIATSENLSMTFFFNHQQPQFIFGRPISNLNYTFVDIHLQAYLLQAGKFNLGVVVNDINAFILNSGLLYK